MPTKALTVLRALLSLAAGAGGLYLSAVVLGKREGFAGFAWWLGCYLVLAVPGLLVTAALQRLVRSRPVAFEDAVRGETARGDSLADATMDQRVSKAASLLTIFGIFAANFALWHAWYLYFLFGLVALALTLMGVAATFARDTAAERAELANALRTGRLLPLFAVWRFQYGSGNGRTAAADFVRSAFVGLSGRPVDIDAATEALDDHDGDEDHDEAEPDYASMTHAELAAEKARLEADLADLEADDDEDDGNEDEENDAGRAEDQASGEARDLAPILVGERATTEPLNGVIEPLALANLMIVLVDCWSPTGNAGRERALHRAAARAGNWIADLQQRQPLLERQAIIVVKNFPGPAWPGDAESGAEVVNDVAARAARLFGGHTENSTTCFPRDGFDAWRDHFAAFRQPVTLVVLHAAHDSDAFRKALAGAHRNHRVFSVLDAAVVQGGAHLLATSNGPCLGLLKKVLTASTEFEAVVLTVNLLEAFLRHHALALALLVEPARLLGPDHPAELKSVTIGSLVGLLQRLIPKVKKAWPVLAEAWQAQAFDRASLAPLKEAGAAALDLELKFPNKRVTALELAKEAGRVRNSLAHGAATQQAAGLLAAPLLDAYLRLAAQIGASCDLRTDNSPQARTTLTVGGQTIMDRSGAPLLRFQDGGHLMFDELHNGVASFISYENGAKLAPDIIDLDVEQPDEIDRGESRIA